MTHHITQYLPGGSGLISVKISYSVTTAYDIQFKSYFVVYCLNVDRRMTAWQGSMSEKIVFEKNANKTRKDT